MPPTPASPRIVSHKWGQIEVEGYEPFRDVKLFPGGAKEWNWQETGTRHSPGIQPADAEELVEQGAEVIVLSSGVLGRLKVQPDTIAALEARGIQVHVKRTNAAVKLFEDLREREAVGALIHTTC